VNALIAEISRAFAIVARRADRGGRLTGTAGLLGFVTGDVLPPLAFAGGAMILAGAIRGGSLCGPNPKASNSAAPDWSVICRDRASSDAIAITDRAGRLVCANGRFTEWFGTSPPPLPPLAAADPTRADEAARIAWRDGSALVEEVTAAAGTFSLSVERAGRGEDHLVWPGSDRPRRSGGSGHFRHRGQDRPRARARDQAPWWRPTAVLAANRSFAERAAGVDEAGIVGSDFVRIEADAQQDIYFCQRTRTGPSVRFLHVPISDPDDGRKSIRRSVLRCS
jgi:two-component system cell cycle sensor histidine kinase/response regulator CckA